MSKHLTKTYFADYIQMDLIVNCVCTLIVMHQLLYTPSKRTYILNESGCPPRSPFVPQRKNDIWICSTYTVQFPGCILIYHLKDINKCGL